MSFIERTLSLWVRLCIVAGVVLGQLMPGVFQAIGAAEIAKVNLPVAALIWLMIVPMLVKIDFFRALGSAKALARHRGHAFRQLGGEAILHGSARHLLRRPSFSPIPARRSDRLLYRGLILLAAAPCTAMVFVWSTLVRGEPRFTLSQVALNDVIMCKGPDLTHQTMSDPAIQLIAEIIGEADPFLSMTAFQAAAGGGRDH